MEQMPEDIENYTLAGIILILDAELIEAEKVLLEGLRHDPDNCDLLFNLGFLDEQRKEHVSALDLYKRAELAAKTRQQERDIQVAVQRVMKNIKGGMVFKKDSYSITLEGNRNPVVLEYWLDRLVRQKQVLEALLLNLDTRVKTVLEVECQEWVIAKNLADLGFKVKAFAPEKGTILKAIGVEFQEKLRKVGVTPAKYYHVQLGEDNLDSVSSSDALLLLPVDLEWYRQRGAEAAGRLIAALARKANRQLFFLVPQGMDREEVEAALLLNLLQTAGEEVADKKPVVCWTGEDGSRLYRLDLARNVKINPEVIVPRGLDAARSSNAVFEVEVEKCRDLNAMSYTEEGWNHFVTLLKQLQENPELEYEDSILKAYYDRFQPRNRQEQLFEKDEKELPPLSEGWTLMPWRDPKGLKLNPEASPISRPGGNHHYGPNTDDFGRREFKKIKDTFVMIKRFGYHPEIFPDGHIQGYFLKNGSDYRFIVNEGQHRMAVLSVLGYEVIRCKHNPRYERMVDIKKIAQWPHVKSGLFSRKLAERVFMHYFESNGREKAEYLGLA